MNWWTKLYEQTPARPGKSMAGCLVANVILVIALAALFYLVGVPLRWLQ